MILLAVAAILVVLAIVTQLGVARIARAHPPLGRMVAVEGGALHVLEQGPPDAPAIVLLHGASGNLNDMRLALADRLSARHRVIMIDRPGHGWSDRPGGAGDASPARQAELIHQALVNIGVKRAVILGHSWSGALATAYALAYPDAVTGLVLLAPVTHPWPGGVAMLNHIVTTPVLGPLVAYTVIYPAGLTMVNPGIEAVFVPQTPPPDYGENIAVKLLLRPAEFIANAQDLVVLKAFVSEQSKRYGEIKAPVTIISGDADKTVFTDIHSRGIAAQLTQAKLIVLPGVGHMVQYAATDLVTKAVEDMAAGAR